MRVAIYGRVSSEKQEKQETIKSQLQALRDYAKKNNYTIYEEYTDDGYSGELLDRPALDRLRDDAKKKLFEAVLIHSPDRLSRKFIYSGLIQEELGKSHINVIFLNRPDSKDTPEDNLLNGVQGLIAEYEKAKILERTRRGRIHKAKSGILVGGRAPYGYRYISGNKTTNTVGRYEIIPNEARTVRLIFDLLVNKHLKIRAIARELTNRGITPRQGKQWRTSSLHKIIRNETYIGNVYYNKNILVESATFKNGNKYRRTKKTSHRLRPKDQWIPISLPDSLKIIDKKTFEVAQMQLKKNSEIYDTTTKHKYLLKGLVKCGECDSPFRAEPCHDKLFYRCGNRHRTFPLPKECRASSVRAEKLESVVWDKFCEVIRNPKLIEEQINRLKEKQEKGRSNIGRDIEAIDKELKGMEGEENRLLDAYREHIITIDQLKDQMAKVQEKKKLLDQEKQGLLSKQESSISKLSVKKTINDYCKQVERRLDSLKDDFDGKSYLLHLAINKIVVDGNKVRIKGIIPTAPVEGPTQDDGNLSTILGRCVRRLLRPRGRASRAPGPSRR